MVQRITSLLQLLRRLTSQLPAGHHNRGDLVTEHLSKTKNTNSTQSVRQWKEQYAIVLLIDNQRQI